MVPDFLVDAESAATRAESADDWTMVQAQATLGTAQQLKRIADVLEFQPDRFARETA